MKTTLSTNQAANILADDQNSTFTRAGAFALVEYLEQMEEDCGQEMEFDAVAIRCDYSEYADLLSWSVDYFGAEHWRDELAIRDDSDLEEMARKSTQYIQDRGQLIEFDGGIIVSSF